MKYEVFQCAKCHKVFSDRSFHVTLRSGRKICEECIFEAMNDRREQEGKE